MTDKQLAILLWQYAHQLDIILDNFAETLLMEPQKVRQECAGIQAALEDLVAHLHEDIHLLMGENGGF